MEDIFNRQYRSELLVKKLAGYFTIVAIVISMLGLLSLVMYTTSLRTKEVGIRKVLGATVRNILHLLSKEYARLISIALVIAIPVSYYVMSEWLSGYVYRISMSWWLFAVGPVIAFVLTYIVIGYSTARIALSNPIDHLRDE